MVNKFYTLQDNKSGRFVNVWQEKVSNEEHIETFETDHPIPFPMESAARTIKEFGLDVTIVEIQWEVVGYHLVNRAGEPVEKD